MLLENIHFGCAMFLPRRTVTSGYGISFAMLKIPRGGRSWGIYSTLRTYMYNTLFKPYQFFVEQGVSDPIHGLVVIVAQRSEVVANSPP